MRGEKFGPPSEVPEAVLRFDKDQKERERKRKPYIFFMHERQNEINREKKEEEKIPIGPRVLRLYQRRVEMGRNPETMRLHDEKEKAGDTSDLSRQDVLKLILDQKPNEMGDVGMALAYLKDEKERLSEEAEKNSSSIDQLEKIRKLIYDPDTVPPKSREIFPIIKLPNDIELQAKLERKHAQYIKRIKEKGEGRENEDASQIDYETTCKAVILERLIDDGEVDTFEFLGTETSEFHSHVPKIYEGSVGVIKDYVETGGKHVIGGGGLK